MSLKVFHLLFVVASVILALAVGGWGFQRWMEEGSGTGLALAVLFFVAGFALVVYGFGFSRKMREIGE